ncbi:MAG: type II toxin-antitoxin system Phd/YefM family antitoxin [Pseudomonadota bacterium]|uniref:type II toxin-antitoxin system Phd/YefM family antitoxin n=1 Tax=Fodinicurvata fenggangensis TaxID=1121830 RepID=UPI00068A3842|nr:type II toxin-antitoxin system Phd/YefM family antitoxin [Fodinicurvata fenggangensis]
MKTVNIHEAKTHFSRLINQAVKGEEIIISRAGKPVARLLRYETPKVKREAGVFRGKLRIGPDFDAPLPADIAEAFGCESTGANDSDVKGSDR